ncbi:urea transporter [Tissierella creatinini]|nr:urea transporter [Tissierella creatinini]TJX61967.1 urea transporter [Soehngenia saccharolytica]
MENNSNHEVNVTPYYLMSSILKNISQVILLENTISGLIILVAITIANYQLGIVALLSSIVGTLVALLAGGDRSLIEKGLFGYNSVLTGLALYLFLADNMRMIIAILGAAFVVIFSAAMMHFMKNLNIPVITFPYIVLTWFLLLTSYHLEIFKLSSSLVPQDLTQWQLITKGNVNIIAGFADGIGQVYFLDKLLPSGLIILAIFWASRKLGIYAIIGTLVSWLVAYTFGAEHNILNLGLYGYNVVFAILAVGLVFEGDKPFALMSGIIAAAITVPLTAGMNTWLSIYGLPVLTMPFVLVTWIFIGARKVLPKL